MKLSGFIASILLFSAAVEVAAVPPCPELQSPVNDFAGILTREEATHLQRVLVDFADSTSNQICVVTTNDLEGYDVGEYAINIGREWHVGSDEFNNGIVFLIKPKTGNSGGAAFIAVGKGLEGTIPDAYCYRIVNDIAIPYFSSGDYYNGILEACFRLMELADSEYHSPYKDDELTPEDWGRILLAIIVFIIIISALSSRRGGGGGNGSRRGGFFFPIGMGGGSSGGSFGGGFSGGFGGGSFGGGGAGGRW